MLPASFTRITLLKHPKFSMSTWFMRAALSIFMWTSLYDQGIGIGCLETD